MLEMLDSYNCSIDWLSSSCPVLTKYRHSETVDYNPWVKRPKLRQFLTWKAGGSRQVGQKPPKKVKWDKAKSFQPRFWSSIRFSPVILFTCQRVISNLKKGFFLVLGKFSDCQMCYQTNWGVYIRYLEQRYNFFCLRWLNAVELICHSGLRE